MTNELFNKIENYLLGLMSDEDKKAFEAEIAADEALAKAVEVQHIEHETLDLALEDDLRAQMATWEKKKDAKIVPLYKSVYNWAAAAAVLLIVAFAANWLFFPTKTDEQIALSYYEDPSTGTKGDSDTTDIDKSVKLIEKRQFVEAIKVLESGTFNNAETIQKQFILSHCFFSQKDYASAEQTLEKIPLITNDIGVIQKAEWTLVLVKLSAGHRNKDDQFKALLQKIATDTNHIYQQKALQLKGQLK